MGGSAPVKRALAAALTVVSFTASSASAAPTAGQWGPVLDWPIIPIHMVVTPDGRVLSYGSDEKGRQTGYLVYDIFDPTTGRHTTLPNHTGTDIFCATQLIIPATGEILISGGDQFINDPTSPRPTHNHGNASTTIFDPVTDELASIEPMANARWYATQVVLPDGRILIAGGLDQTGLGQATVPEVWDPATRRWSALPGAPTPGADWFYPRLFVMPDGKVFGLGSTTMWVIDPNAASRDPAAWWRWQRGSITSYGPVEATGTGTGTGTGTSTGTGRALRHNVGFRATAVMFEPGRILQVGGGSNEATIIDVTGGRPIVSGTEPMTHGRHWPNATLLPDGTVLVTGGSSLADEANGGSPGTVYRSPELWSPTTGRWTTLPAESQPRLYHSTALLLADATVLSGGGGAYLPAPGVEQARIDHLDAQVFSPGYLDAPTRPVIDAAPADLTPGQSFTVVVGSGRPVSSLVLLKLPSVTHSFDNEQRLIPLEFAGGGTGGAITATAPPDTTTATPGYYYLFAIDVDGVPSVARIVAFATITP